MRQRVACAWGGAVAVALAPVVAAADDAFTVVNITEAGPDRPLPVGSSFYLTGEADKDVNLVQPIVVRKATRWLLGGDGPTCTELERELEELQTTTGPDALKLDTGLRPASAIWKGAGASSYDALVPSPWERKPGADGKFKVLVPSDGGFFRTGGSYCLFVYKRSTKLVVDTKAIKGILLASAGAHNACAAQSVSCYEAADKQHIADRQRGLDDADARLSAARGACATQSAACYTTAEAQRSGALQKAMKALPAGDQKKLSEAVRKAENASFQIIRAPRTALAILAWWAPSNPAAPPQAFANDPNLPLPLPSEGNAVSPLGRAIMIMLARHGALYPQAEVDKSGVRSTRYYTSDGKVKVGAVGVLDEARLTVAEVGDNGIAGKPAPLAVTTGDLKLPGDSVTLRDLLEFTRGRVRVDGRYLTARELRARLDPILKGSGRVGDDDAKLLRAVRASIGALDAAILRLVLRSAAGAEPGKAPPPGTEAAIEVDLGAWLTPLLKPCDETALQAWGLRAVPGAPGCEADKARQGWPGFLRGNSPLGHLENALVELEASRNTWADIDAELAVRTETIVATPMARAFGAKIEFTRDSWFFSYVTPVTGIAFPLSPKRAFNVPYVGVHIHAVPNPVDEPMWTNGLRDVLRVLALEVAMGTTSGPFGETVGSTLGEDGRFEGWNSLPPMFVGLSFHLIPYTSFTCGATLLERRSSTVVEQRREAFFSRYFGANVQLNVPDLVDALKGRTSTTTVDKK
ncbi:hypothetical protein WMF30_18310 [Sorangium sp. So ce134]